MNGTLDQNTNPKNATVYYARLCALMKARQVQLQAEIQRQNQARENERKRRQEEEIEQKAFWIRNKLCRHCGGSFEGWLSKKCTLCGRAKDY